MTKQRVNGAESVFQVRSWLPFLYRSPNLVPIAHSNDKHTSSILTPLADIIQAFDGSYITFIQLQVYKGSIRLNPQVKNTVIAPSTAEEHE